MGGDLSEEFGTLVFRIGQQQNPLFARSKNLLRQVQQGGHHLGHGAGRRGRGEADRLLGVSIQQPKRLRNLDGLLGGIVRVSTHVPFAVAAHPMRIESQDFSPEIPARTPQFGQHDLQGQRIGNGVFGQERMNRAVTGNKRQSRRQFKSPAIG